jgi:hypothetical protein
MSDIDDTFRALLSRLYWPTPDVASASCEEIAGLLASPGTCQAAADAILGWLAQQKSEYRAAVGLLPVVYAHDVLHADLERLLTPGKLLSVIRRPSPLTTLYLRVLGAEDWLLATQKPDFMSIEDCCSTDDDDSFGTMVEHGVPPIFPHTTERLSRETQLDCVLHMRGEWEHLKGDAENREMDLDPDIVYDQPDGYVPIVTHAVEVYMSAYLRTLSWLVHRSALTSRKAEQKAAIVSPAILRYWRVRPVSRPAWWPWLETNGSSEAMDDVRHAVEALGRGDHGIGGGSPILHASGRVLSGKRPVDLDILGYFSAAPEALPESAWETTYQQLEEAAVIVPLGLGLPENIPATALGLESDTVRGAALCAASTRLLLQQRGSWQWTSLARGLHAPSGWLTTGDVAAHCRETEVSFDCGDFHIASSIRWNSGLESACARLDRRGSPRSGFVEPSNGTALVTTRLALDGVSERTGMHLAWLCRVRGYSQESGYGSYEITDSFFSLAC